MHFVTQILNFLSAGLVATSFFILSAEALAVESSSTWKPLGSSFSYSISKEALSVRHGSSHEDVIRHLRISLQAVSEKNGYSRGTFHFKRNVLRSSKVSFWKEAQLSESSVLFTGKLTGQCRGYVLVKVSEKSGRQIELSSTVHTQNGSKDCDEQKWEISRQKDELFTGLGIQMPHFILNGNRFPVLTQEQGHGRGKQPVTFVANEIAGGAGGSSVSSYLAVPHFISSAHWSFYLKDEQIGFFDFQDKKSLSVEKKGPWSAVISVGSVPELVTMYTQFSGRMAPLPQWAHRGPIIGVGGGEKKILKTAKMLKSLDIPVSSFWIQDWVGTRQGLIWTRLKWNWKVDRTLYPNWEDMVQRLDSMGFPVLTYFNPRLSEIKGETHTDFDFAVANDFLVKNKKGAVHKVDSGGFDGALIDLTNDEALAFFREKMETQLSMGVRGWMADFGESLPFHILIDDGITGRSYHNAYSRKWSSLHRELLPNASPIVMARTGFSKSPGQVSMFWLGDQLQSWDRYDGLSSAVIGLISGGLSGFSINHSDIGGMIALPIPGAWYVRDRELFARWLEFSAFSPVMRTHEGTNPGLSHQFDHDEQTLAMFKKFAKIYEKLSPYRDMLMKETVETGWPMIRPMIFACENRQECWFLNDQYLYGDDFLVAPVTKKDQKKRKVFFPPGTWKSIWNDSETITSKNGTRTSVSAPLGKPPVFFKEASSYGVNLRDFIRIKQY